MEREGKIKIIFPDVIWAQDFLTPSGGGRAKLLIEFDGTSAVL